MKNQDTLENQVNYAYLGIGSNLGNKKINIEKAKFLINTENTKIIKTSGFYLTKSWPIKSFPEYFNVILLIKTNLNLKNLLTKLKVIEADIGRKPMPKNFPRVCDIDIIDFNGRVFTQNDKFLNLEIPHPRMHNRNFVLIPLYEINKEWVHPKTKKNIVKLISNLKDKDIMGIKLS